MVAISRDRHGLSGLRAARSASRRRASRVGLHYVLILLLLSGLTGVVFAGDLFNVFVFLEVATLSTCALIAMAGGKALVFAFRYLILASIGATFYLLGVSFFYAATGTLNMADMAQRLPALAGSNAVIVGVVFMFLGLAIKMALMPFHGWLPDAYTSAPGRGFAAHLGPGDQGVAVCLGPDHVLGGRCRRQDSELGPVLRVCWMLGAVAAVVGAFLALIQHDVKRMFAYGGVSHIGLIMLGAGLGNQTGLAGSLFYLINDAVMQATLFVVAGIAGTHYGIRLARTAGVAAPAGAVAGGRVIVVGLSMIGIPPTGGFFGKWYIDPGRRPGRRVRRRRGGDPGDAADAGLFARLLVRVFAGEPAAPREPTPPMPCRCAFCVGALCAAIVAPGPVQRSPS